jgi:hypothetical protein
MEILLNHRKNKTYSSNLMNVNWCVRTALVNRKWKRTNWSKRSTEIEMMTTITSVCCNKEVEKMTFFFSIYALLRVLSTWWLMSTLLLSNISNSAVFFCQLKCHLRYSNQYKKKKICTSVLFFHRHQVDSRRHLNAWN